DQRRTQLYREEFQRDKLKDQTLTFREFIESLNLEIDIQPLSTDDYSRASQLTLRTNQFNFTTRRRNEDELQVLLSQEGVVCRSVKVCDRFGDYGFVGLAICVADGSVLNVDTFLLSCRVLGRGVEHGMVAALGRVALDAGLEAVRLTIESTGRNTPARTFLESICPVEMRAESESQLVCELPADLLSKVVFQPADEVGESPAEGPAGPVDAPEARSDDRIRARERQIARTAFELGTVENMQREIGGSGGRPESPVPQIVDAGEVGDHVYATFAGALRLPVETVRERDQLEHLGCDSFKIVEITVALAEKFPWLPSTLLFEHRSVSEIVQRISQLSEQGEGKAKTERNELSTASTRSKSATGHDIAVIGMNVRCAGADSVDELWELVSCGRSAVTPVPVDREYFLGRLQDARPHWAGLLSDLDGFDAEFFGVSPREAEMMDPQLRLILESAWGALEDAGLAGSGHDTETGVFVGVMYHDYAHFANADGDSAISPYRCWESFSLANRLSQVLRFHGPSFAIDTACSSSGTALHLACRSLRDGECNVALVGGINLILDPRRFEQLGGLGILSPTGECRAFGDKADGTVLGEGVGVVVLRPLHEALKRGERIYGVIKGSALSTGAGTVGFTAPNPNAQADAIRSAIGQSGIDPRSVRYVETHGTGTSLGDPIEVRGLTLAYSDEQLFDSTTSIEHRCALGSIKPNIGHLEAGAAVVGLIKVLMQLQRGYLLPSLSSPETNPQIPFDELPFEVQRELEPWDRLVTEDGGKTFEWPRRAGLSSFGVGGANVHVIVEEAPRQTRDADPGSDSRGHLIVLSARHEDECRRQAQRLRDNLLTNPKTELRNVAHTLTVGRRHFSNRLALVADDRDGVVAALERISACETPAGCVRGSFNESDSVPKVAFLFTGQGAQRMGMGRQLYRANLIVRDVVDRCARILDPFLERPLLDVMFAEAGSPAAELLNQTAFTQPALFAVEYAVSELWQSWGVRPDAVLGHSVGELVALCTARAISLEDGLRLIAARGRLMQALPEGGAMVSVRAGEDEVRERLRGREDCVSIAAINGPRQVVVSGTVEAIEEIAGRFAAVGVSTKRLTVSHAFHSPSMEPMLAEYESIARRIEVCEPEIPVVSCIDANFVTVDMLSGDYWTRQVRDAVRFSDALAAVDELGMSAYVEVGPQPVLAGLGRLSLTEVERAWLPSLTKGADEWTTMLRSLGSLYCLGATIDWSAFSAGQRGRFISLPTYPFRHRRHWTENAEHQRDVEDRGDIKSDMVKPYEVVWKPLSDNPDGHIDRTADHWMLCVDDEPFADALIDALKSQGGDCTVVRRGERFEIEAPSSFRVHPSSRTDFERLFAAVDGDARPLRGIVQAWGCRRSSGEDATLEAVKSGHDSVLHGTLNLLQSQSSGDGKFPQLWCVTRGAVAASPADRQTAASIGQSPIWGFGRVAALELPDRWGGLIDLPIESDPLVEAKQVVRRLLGPRGEDQLALRDGLWRAARLVAIDDSQTESLNINADGAYLITGGLGALGLHVAHWLVAKGANRLILTSRRGWDSDGAPAAAQSLTDRGVVVDVVAADVAKPEDVDRLFAQVAAGRGPLRGVVHAAGLDWLEPIAGMTIENLEAMLAPKVAGAWLLHQASRELPLDFFVCFSSFTSVFGSAGRAHYGAGNAFLDGLAQFRRQDGFPALTVNWGPWRGGGMADEESLELLDRMGNRGLEPSVALNRLERLLATGAVHATVADIDWPRFRAVYEARAKRPLLADLDLKDDRTLVPDAGSHAAWADRLRDVGPAERRNALAEFIRIEAAATLGYDDPRDVPVDGDLFSIGMDSLMVVEFSNRLKRNLGVCDTACVLDHPKIAALAAKLANDLPVEASGSRNGRGAHAPPANGSSTGRWLCRLQQVPGDERVAALSSLLRQEVAEVLGFESESDVSLKRNVVEMGMDSLTAVDFARRIERNLGTGEMPQVFDYPNLDALAVSLVSGVPQDAGGPHEIVRFQPELDAEVREFCQSAWQSRRRDWIDARWRWMFVESATRVGSEPHVWLSRSGAGIVGHQGSFCVNVNVAGDELQSAWFVDTMVLESHRGRGIGPRLLTEAVRDIPFNLSLGQTRQMRTIQCQLGWQEVAPLEIWMLIFRPSNVLAQKIPNRAVARAAGWVFKARQFGRRRFASRAEPGLQVRRIDRFDSRHDELWDRVRKHYECAVVRDASYLNWKYVEQPGQSFVRLELSRGEEPVAVAVVMVREADDAYGYRRAFLVELVAAPDDRALLFATFDAVRETCRELQADALLFPLIGARLRPAVRAYGFLQRPATRYFLVCPEGLSEEQRRAVLQAENWLITMGDSDIDRPW
ncbi:MAG: SDR family NAD(P)-dependent oxidoreductase, partial [Planctomycetaceae bacterium]